MNCLACGGRLVPLGSLGRLSHYRCRSCGLDHSHELVDVHEPAGSPGVIAWSDKLTRGTPKENTDASQA